MARWSKEKQAVARGRILEAARDAFEAHGYDEASMRAIAGAAGVAVGTLFNYFPDKATLLREALRADLEEVVEAVETELAGDHHPTSLEALLVGVARPFYTYYCDRPELSVVLLRESLFVSGSASGAFQRQVERVAAAMVAPLERLKAEGLLTADAEPDVIILAFLSHYYFVLMTSLPRADVAEMTRRISLLARQLRRGVGRLPEFG